MDPTLCLCPEPSPCSLAKMYSKPFIVLVTLLLNRARPNSWQKMTRERILSCSWTPSSPLCHGPQYPHNTPHLDSSGDTKYARGDPGFPADFGPATVIRVHTVNTSLLHHLSGQRQPCGNLSLCNLHSHFIPLPLESKLNIYSFGLTAFPSCISRKRVRT